MNILIKISSLLLVITMLPSTNAWSGYDATSGGSVEIESGNLVREGETIDVYDGEYKTMKVESINRFGGSVEIQGTDDTGEQRVLEMDGD
jgi:hypothetical protein